eukprot:COSAG02_NODE_4623_length_5153_cov_3.148793_4_plen_105_part_00
MRQSQFQLPACSVLLSRARVIPLTGSANTRHLLSDYQEDKESMGTSYTFLPRLALQRWDESDIQTGPASRCGLVPRSSIKQFQPYEATDFAGCGRTELTGPACT